MAKCLPLNGFVAQTTLGGHVSVPYGESSSNSAILTCGGIHSDMASACAACAKEIIAYGASGYVNWTIESVSYGYNSYNNAMCLGTLISFVRPDINLKIYQNLDDVSVKPALHICDSIPPLPILIGFFNGVANTREAANASRKRLEVEYGTTYKTRPLKYELFYNQTACGSGLLGLAPCLEDVAEVFAQRNKELGGVLGDRWEIYWEMLAGRQNQVDSITATLLSKLGNSANALLQLLDSIFANILNQLAGSFTKLLTLLSSPATASLTAGHVAKLKTYADQGAGMVLVAHSQGNLFVNAAYDGLKASSSAANVKVVHAAPASPTLRGDYVLADIDLVINGLRVTGVNSVSAANISLPLSNKDASGHGFEPTYLDAARAAYARVKTMITTALDAVSN